MPGSRLPAPPGWTALTGFYADTYEVYRQEQEERVKGIREFYKILSTVTPFRHPTGIPITAEDVQVSACDMALYVLARRRRYLLRLCRYGTQKPRWLTLPKELYTISMLQSGLAASC